MFQCNSNIMTSSKFISVIYKVMWDELIYMYIYIYFKIYLKNIKLLSSEDSDKTGFLSNNVWLGFETLNYLYKIFCS